jgi:hypothetical protein
MLCECELATSTAVPIMSSGAGTEKPKCSQRKTGESRLAAKAYRMAKNAIG